MDTLRSAAGTPAHVGMNSVLLVRHAAHLAVDTAHAVQVMANTSRGVTWLYSVCDMGGGGAIIEAAASGTDEQFTRAPLAWVSNKELLAALPSADFVTSHSPLAGMLHDGLIVRDIAYEYPDEFTAFNNGTLRAVGAPMPSTSDPWGPVGQTFKSWEEEDERLKVWRAAAGARERGPRSRPHAAQVYQDNWFTPQRESRPDVVVVSNNAIVPQARIAQMGALADLFAKSAHAPQWRYDRLVQQLTAVAEQGGGMTLADAIDVITFLSPEKTPGYFHKYLHPSQPMSAQIEGMIAVMDLRAGVVGVKTGYWADPFVYVTMRNYLA